MSKQQREEDYRKIESWEELRAHKLKLQGEIETLGGHIASSAKEVVIKGVKVTAATVASVAVAKGIAAYASMRREKGHENNSAAELKAEEAAPASESNGHLATLFTYIDILI